MNIRLRLPAMLSGISLTLAVAVSSWIALLPDYYQGMSKIEVQGEAPRELTGLTASFIEMNGLRGVLTLFIPVFITLAGFLVSLRAGYYKKYRRVIMWILAVLLLLFCAAGVLSIGTFYLPSAIALFLAAVSSQHGKVEKI